MKTWRRGFTLKKGFKIVQQLSFGRRVPPGLSSLFVAFVSDAEWRACASRRTPCTSTPAPGFPRDQDELVLYGAVIGRYGVNNY